MHFVGVVYRAHDPRWAWNPLSGEGARQHGGRFNPVSVAALYLSLSPWCAIREATPIKFPLQPRTLCAYRVDSRPIFDATDPQLLSEFSVSQSDLGCEWKNDLLLGIRPKSHELVDEVMKAGYIGLLAPSFAYDAGPDDRNLVLWKYGPNLPSRVSLIDDFNVLSTRDGN